MMQVQDEPDGATPLGPDELVGLKFKSLSTRRELDVLEQANVESGLLWLTRRQETMNQRRLRSIAALCHADRGDLAAVLAFVGA